MLRIIICLKYLFIAVCLISTDPGFCQVKIFTADSINLIEWYDNQRKIVRCPEPGIIAEGNNEIYFSYNLNTPAGIMNGKKATLAVDKFSNIHMVYEDDGIRYSFTQDKESWSPAIEISDSCERVSFAVADCDIEGNVHIIYGLTDSCIRNTTCLSSLKYVMVSDNQKQLSATIFKMSDNNEKDTLLNYTIATHLLYNDSTIFVAYQLSNDSVYIKSSGDNGKSWKLISAFPGTEPSLSIGCGVYSGEIIENAIFPAILYLDKDGNLLNGYADHYLSISDTLVWYYTDKLIQNSPIDHLCIDDVISPFGFSYIFQKNGMLYHGFKNLSSGSEIRDTVTDNVIVSSIAYKQFDAGKVDIIWYEKSGDKYEMYYQWFEKITFADYHIDQGSNQLQIAACPNPFKAEIRFTVYTTEPEKDLKLTIYTVEGKLLKTFSSKINNTITEIYWDGTTNNGYHLNNGVYIVNVISGSKSITRKIMFSE